MAKAKTDTAAAETAANEAATNGDNSTIQEGTREPVTARGVELLTLVKNAPNGILFLTRDEGIEAANAGYITVDPTNTNGDTAAVTLTDAGNAALDRATNSSASSRATANGFTIEDNVPMPADTGSRRGRSGGYPFEALQIGQSFHVAASKGKSLDAMLTMLSSSVSSARTRFAEETGEVENYTKKEYKKDENGKFVKDDDGKRVVISEAEDTRPVLRYTRDFKAAKVGANDSKGEGIRIWRVEVTGATQAAQDADTENGDGDEGED